MPTIGPMELIVVLLVALVVVGPRKLPQLGRSLGTGMREIKDSVTRSDPRAALNDADDDGPVKTGEYHPGAPPVAGPGRRPRPAPCWPSTSVRSSWPRPGTPGARTTDPPASSA